jgi:hypothetical protein|tara:strand:- start:2128 stop:2265 length:138 start_codon:yes stop_codon:yes gene_type:complete
MELLWKRATPEPVSSRYKSSRFFCDTLENNAKDVEFAFASSIVNA